MSFLADEKLHKAFVEALNKNEAFNTQALMFDGSVLLEVDADQLWLKIYKGKVIDHETQIPAFGYTFKFSGSEKSWQYLISGDKRWADLTFPGKRYFDDDPQLERVGELSVDIATEGNLLEAGRLTEAMFEMAYTLRNVASN
ncbi:MAG: hypothetical protein ACU84Q_05810 [Gammaproteobacteria bacterium]